MFDHFCRFGTRICRLCGMSLALVRFRLPRRRAQLLRFAAFCGSEISLSHGGLLVHSFVLCIRTEIDHRENL